MLKINITDKEILLLNKRFQDLNTDLCVEKVEDTTLINLRKLYVGEKYCRFCGYPTKSGNEKCYTEYCREEFEY